MSRIFVAAFLLLFGLNLVAGAILPNWLIGLVAIIAGVLVLVDSGALRAPRK